MDKEKLLYTKVHTRDSFPDFCSKCSHYGDEICEKCLKEYNEKLKDNDRNDNS